VTSLADVDLTIRQASLDEVYKGLARLADLSFGAAVAVALSAPQFIDPSRLQSDPNFPLWSQYLILALFIFVSLLLWIRYSQIIALAHRIRPQCKNEWHLVWLIAPLPCILFAAVLTIADARLPANANAVFGIFDCLLIVAWVSVLVSMSVTLSVIVLWSEHKTRVVLKAECWRQWLLTIGLALLGLSGSLGSVALQSAVTHTTNWWIQVIASGVTFILALVALCAGVRGTLGYNATDTARRTLPL
jgi:hypothetical protein